MLCRCIGVRAEDNRITQSHLGAAHHPARAHLEFIALVGTSHMRQLHCAVSIIVSRLCHKSFLIFRIIALSNTSAQTALPLQRCLRGNGRLEAREPVSPLTYITI